MTINPIEPFDHDLIGDDAPYVTIRYRDVPDGYRISDLVIDETAYPELAAIIDDLNEIAERYYKNYEITGVTVQEFFEHLQDALAFKIKTFNAFLKGQAAAKPGPVNKVTFKPATTDTVEQLTDSETQNINVALDDPDEETPANRVKSKDGTRKSTRGGQDVTEYSSDDFNELAEFLKGNPSVEQEYIMIFRECFTLMAAWKW